jgi:hypothetical protein
VEAALEGDEKYLWVNAHLVSVRNAGANDDVLRGGVVESKCAFYG